VKSLIVQGVWFKFPSWVTHLYTNSDFTSENGGILTLL
jgi:hypothetical protein